MVVLSCDQFDAMKHSTAARRPLCQNVQYVTALTLKDVYAILAFGVRKALAAPITSV
jgi:hypothetical protein